ncbi:MAG: hypothetical protein A3G35_12545 [candidate division NC10 bacterium RIFCSPLOWO2_12_FULL_66_18]|nr:MAG: hypothetical protein A3G35_12545 [candidate division NC10 bacterium RIFCSPLOWO2_12_FULL_66_18]
MVEIEPRPETGDALRVGMWTQGASCESSMALVGGYAVLDLSQPALASEPPKPSAQWTRLGQPLHSNRQAQYRERRAGGIDER